MDVYFKAIMEQETFKEAYRPGLEGVGRSYYIVTPNETYDGVNREYKVEGSLVVCVMPKCSLERKLKLKLVALCNLVPLLCTKFSRS